MFGQRGADVGVTDGADRDAIFINLGSQAVEEGLHSVFGGSVWRTGRNFFYLTLTVREIWSVSFNEALTLQVDY